MELMPSLPPLPPPPSPLHIYISNFCPHALEMKSRLAFNLSYIIVDTPIYYIQVN